MMNKYETEQERQAREARQELGRDLLTLLKALYGDRTKA